MQKLFRLIYILFVLARFRIDRIIFNTRWFYAIRFLTFLNPYNWFADSRSDAERLRLALEKLGPIFVKFGQMLSTRMDLLSDEFVNELAKLQDNVPPFSGAQAKQILRQVYQQELSELFLEFDSEPLASASIAQVHQAILFDGREVVVKILRPNIRQIIIRDIALLYSVANLIQRFWSDGYRFHPREVVAEFESCLLDELDLMREAANASQLRRNFFQSPLLYVPEVYWAYARSQVIVMERIQGIRVSDINCLKEKQFDLKKLAERGVEIFFTQVFRDCFFHADMHPGNIFVNENSMREPSYIAVDFGIVGTLNPADQRYLAENFLAFFNRDYRRVAQLHIESNWVAYDTKIDAFESAIRTVCEPIFEKPLKDISCAQVLLNLFRTAQRFQMEVQPQLILLQKTLLNVEGLGRQLYPELDLWSTAKPFLEKWIKKQIGFRATLKKLKDHAPFMMEKIVDLPDLIHSNLQYLNLLKNEHLANKNKTNEKIKYLKRAKQKGFVWGIISSSSLLILFYYLHLSPIHF